MSLSAESSQQQQKSWSGNQEFVKDKSSSEFPFTLRFSIPFGLISVSPPNFCLAQTNTQHNSPWTWSFWNKFENSACLLRIVIKNPCLSQKSNKLQACIFHWLSFSIYLFLNISTAEIWPGHTDVWCCSPVFPVFWSDCKTLKAAILMMMVMLRTTSMMMMMMGTMKRIVCFCLTRLRDFSDSNSKVILSFCSWISFFVRVVLP